MYSLYIVKVYSVQLVYCDSVQCDSVQFDSVKCDSVEQSATVCRYRPDVTSFPVDCPPRPPRPSSFALNTAYTAGDTSLYCTLLYTAADALLHCTPYHYIAQGKSALHCTEGLAWATIGRADRKSQQPLPIVHYSL